MSYVTKWLLKVNEGELIVKKEKISSFMPINRKVEEVGFYQYDFIDMGDYLYQYTFYPQEIDTTKSAVLVGRFEKTKGSMVMSDMTTSDFKNMDLFYEKFFTPKLIS